MSLPNVLIQAEGRWYGILNALGFTAQQLNGRNQPCPWCGGKDRFRWDDKGKGKFYCSQCGHGDGLDMLIRQGFSMGEALTEIEKLVSVVKKDTKPVMMADELKKRLNKIWGESKEIVEGDEAWQYLQSRGLIPARNLRFHPSLHYTGGVELKLPAMIAKITNVDGIPIAIHRTYLQNGRKAPYDPCKKVFGKLAHGASIRLYPAAETMGIAEGKIGRAHV